MSTCQRDANERALKIEKLVVKKGRQLEKDGERPPNADLPKTLELDLIFNSPVVQAEQQASVFGRSTKM